MLESPKSIEVTEQGYRDFLKGHPRRQHLRHGIEPAIRGKHIAGPMHFIYDLDCYCRLISHGATALSHAVAYRYEGTDGRMHFFITPSAKSG